jgi:hypothetical protein
MPRAALLATVRVAMVVTAALDRAATVAPAVTAVRAVKAAQM